MARDMSGNRFSAIIRFDKSKHSLSDNGAKMKSKMCSLRFTLQNLLSAYICLSACVAGLPAQQDSLKNTESQTTSVANNYLAAIEAGDWKKMTMLLSNKAHYSDPTMTYFGDAAVDIDGAEGIVEFWRKSRSDSEVQSLKFKIQKQWTSGDTTTYLIEDNLQLPGNAWNVDAQCISVTISHVAMIRVTNNKVVFHSDSVDYQRFEEQIDAAREKHGMLRGEIDHHVHILSPRLLADWKSLGMPFSQKDSAYTSVTEIARSVRAKRFVALSMAYLFGSSWFERIDGIDENEEKWVSAENDYIADCVKGGGGKCIGFFSVNPLKEYAIREIKRCSENRLFSGLKIHCLASDISMDNEVHKKRLLEVFELCEAKRIPVMVHFAGTPDDSFGQRQVNSFWNIVAAHPKLEIVLAHLGASGGFNANSKMIIQTYNQLCKEDQGFAKMHVYFDLSGAILINEVDGIEPTSEDLTKQLAQIMIETGLKKFLPASDYPAFSIEDAHTSIKDHLPLSKKQLNHVFRNRARFLKK